MPRPQHNLFGHPGLFPGNRSHCRIDIVVFDSAPIISLIDTEILHFLTIGPEKYFKDKEISQIVERAKKYNNFVRIDMEDSSTTSDIITLYKKLYEKYPENVGIVLQVYLKRTMDDIIELNKLKTDYRLCKGIYVEPKEIAYKGREEIRDSFIDCLNKVIDDDCYIGIATHDDPIVKRAYKIIEDRKF